MKSYQYRSLILIIILSLLSLLSNPVVRRVRAVEEKATAPGQRNERLASEANWRNISVVDLLPDAASQAALAVGARLNPSAALAVAGLTFTVNSTADPGTGICDPTECTLREAITAANAAPGSDTIAFNIPGPGPHTIIPLSPLPAITSPVVIDGYTQPGAIANTLPDDDNAVLMIELNGSAATTAGAVSLLNITGGSSTVRGLVINRSDRAIGMDTNGGNIIEGNFLGTNVAGSAVSPNQYGVLVSTGSSNNVIGGTTPAARNLISGNSFGVSLAGGSGNMVQGNFIGTDHTGTNDLGNSEGVNVVASSSNTIGGTAAGARNVVSGNNSDIRMQADNNVIQGNYIGVSATGGAFNYSNISALGITISNSTGSSIGGTTPAARNVISGHSIGISLNSGPSTIVQGNFIGTDATGTVALGNTNIGIDLGNSTNSVIGGTASGAGNLISANGTGISISGFPGLTIQVQGNLIGTDVSGTADLGNSGVGVSISGGSSFATNITIGGTVAGARNVISGNNGDGIDLRNLTGTVVQGNLIGLQINGTSPLGNSGHGINIVSTFNNTIGGTAPGAGNRIAFNGASLNSGGGIIIDGLTGSNNNPLRGNSIFANTSNGTLANRGLGIDLSVSGSGNGPTSNDACDGDTGPNNLQNFPVLSSAVSDGSTTTIIGTLNSAAGTAFAIDFYSSPACDPSGNGEGQTYLGSTTVTTDSSCSASINVILTVSVPAGNVVTATATDPSGNTSEFSSCTLATAPPSFVSGISGSGVYNGTATLTATLSSGSPLSGKTVSFTRNSTSVGTATTDSSGVATLSGVSLSGINAGTYANAVGASFAGDANYAGSSGTGTLTVSKASQTITFGTLANRTFGDPDFTVSAAASSSLSVSFSATGNCTVSGNTVHMTGVGLCTITASQAGDSNYNAAPSVGRSFTVGEPISTIQFEQTSYNVTEDVTFTPAAVIRTGDTSGAATVDYATMDGTASERSDYTTEIGTLHFAAGEARKTIELLISEDSYVEGPETYSVVLSNPVGGTLGSPATATVQITDDVSEPATNAIDDSSIFVGQHYHDFLARQAEQGGQGFWTNKITVCGGDAACIQRQRIGVSAQFFIELEFQQTGFYLYRAYKAALGRRPTYVEFITDRSRLRASPNLGAEQAAYILEFVQRGEFLGKYASTTTAATFVDALIQNVNITSGVDLMARRSELMTEYNAGTDQTDSRARTLRKLIDYGEFQNAEFNRGFVLAQYIGYLRRDPDTAGYNYWVDNLNSNPTNFRGMVCSFITSFEYQDRFGALHMHSNAECSGSP